MKVSNQLKNDLTQTPEKFERAFALLLNGFFIKYPTPTARAFVRWLDANKIIELKKGRDKGIKAYNREPFIQEAIFFKPSLN